MRYRYPRRNPAADLTLVEELDALAARVADLEAEGEFVDLYDKARPILNRHLGRHLGPSADWLNPTWRLGGDLYLFEGDDNDYTVLSRTPNEDPDEPDVIEEVEALRSLDALRRYFRARKNPVDVVDFPDELKDLVDGYKNEFVADVTGPWADYDVVVDQYVARIMRDLGDTPYESETASDDFIDRWEKGLVEAEVMVMLGAALESRGRGRAAHQTPVPARRNPRKTPPPPPPSHTFQLTADPYQQRLFGPEAFEQRPKKRAVEPMPVDERQVDLFAPPPPPKKNPRANPTCPKCGGTGKLYSFRHVEQGTCFRCGGTGEVDKLTPAEKGQAAPPPPTGSYGVRISSEDYNAIQSGYSSFEEANRQRKELAEEHKDATYTVVKFDGKEWRTRSGEPANPRRRR